MFPSPRRRRAVTLKKYTKKRAAREELFCQSKPIGFSPFSLTSPSSLLTLPTAQSRRRTGFLPRELRNHFPRTFIRLGWIFQAWLQAFERKVEAHFERERSANDAKGGRWGSRPNSLSFSFRTPATRQPRRLEL